jgi:hypothetical protein
MLLLRTMPWIYCFLLLSLCICNEAIRTRKAQKATCNWNKFLAFICQIMFSWRVHYTCDLQLHSKCSLLLKICWCKKLELLALWLFTVKLKHLHCCCQFNGLQIVLSLGACSVYHLLLYFTSFCCVWLWRALCEWITCAPMRNLYLHSYANTEWLLARRIIYCH